jgi:DNA-binding NarL/FixJ family response regulator
MTSLAIARVLHFSRMPKTPIAVYQGEEKLHESLARAQASMGLEGLAMTPAELKVLADAIRKGLSREEYVQRVADSVLRGKHTK